MPSTTIAAMAAQPVRRDPLGPEEVAHELALLGPRWSTRDGELHLDLPGHMSKTGAVAAFIGKVADEIQHHPTITITYPRLAIAVNTHDAGNAITALDFILAARIEDYLRANDWK